MRIAGIVLLTAALARPALADDEVTRLDTSRRWEGSFGLRIGSFMVGPFDGVGVGVHLDGGVRFDRLQLLGEYSYLAISNDTSTSSDAMSTAPPSATPTLEGIVQRLGVDARYSVAKIAGRDVPLRGDFWLEAGLGEQFVRWQLGGELHRPDVSLGFGGQFSGRFGQHHDHHAGIYYALKVELARAPTSYANLPSTCAGPCDSATRPISIDRSFLFNLGIIFGN